MKPDTEKDLSNCHFDGRLVDFDEFVNNPQEKKRVVFCTYTLLASKLGKKFTELQKFTELLGGKYFDGLVMFDIAH